MCPLFVYILLQLFVYYQSMKNFKLYPIYLLLFGTIVTLSSCEKLKGKGDNVTTLAAIDETYSNLIIDIPCHINISYSEDIELSINAQQNITDNMYFLIEDNTLSVEFIEKVYEHNPITLDLQMSEFRDIILNRQIELNVVSDFETPSRIRIEINGNSDVNFSDTVSCLDLLYIDNSISTFNADYITCSRNYDFTGNGETEMNLNGYAKNAYITVNDYLEFEGFNFITETTKIETSGYSPTTNIYVENKLEAIITGSATIRYKGSPTSIITSASTGDLDINSAE